MRRVRVADLNSSIRLAWRRFTRSLDQNAFDRRQKRPIRIDNPRGISTRRADVALRRAAYQPNQRR